jgi:signal transduction histidine kinase
MFIYQAWPWREWEFTNGYWKWFPWLSHLDNLAIFELKTNFTGSLFFLPIIYAAIAFNWQVTLFVSLLSLVYSLLAVGLWGDLNSILTNMTLLLLPAAIITIFNIEAELRRKNKRVFIEREEEHRLYTLKVLETQENERRRLAQELHDDTIQTLLVIAKGAQALTVDNDIDKMKSRAESIKEISLQAIEDVRRLSLDLRPSILDDLGLISALRWLAERLNKEAGVNTKIDIEGTIHEMTPQMQTVLFRIVQEALNNIKRHSQANEAAIKLEFTSDALTLTICDNGKGFSPPKELTHLVTQNKLGLIGMQERVESIGGRFEIKSEPEKGTSIKIEVTLLNGQLYKPKS